MREAGNLEETVMPNSRAVGQEHETQAPHLELTATGWHRFGHLLRVPEIEAIQLLTKRRLGAGLAPLTSSGPVASPGARYSWGDGGPTDS